MAVYGSTLRSAMAIWRAKEAILVFATRQHATVRPLQPRLERKQGSRQHRGVHHPVAIRSIGFRYRRMGRPIVLPCKNDIQRHLLRPSEPKWQWCDSLDTRVALASNDARRACAHQHSLLCAAPFDCHLYQTASALSRCLTNLPIRALPKKVFAPI